MSALLVSVVIPTHNRADMLARSLVSFARQQNVATSAFEVIVVADSCKDNTADIVVKHQRLAPFPLRLVLNTAMNAAATRNLGAARATADTLIFMDDDMEAAPGLVAAHLSMRSPRAVVIGYSKPVLPIKASQWQLEARLWWEDRFTELLQRGHRFTYRDFFSGNFSISASLFRSSGGFEPRVGHRLEDYEFGYRLLKHGNRLVFSREALGFHHETTDLPLFLGRVRMDGASDVRMSEIHPELRSRVFPVRRFNRVDRASIRLAFAAPEKSQPVFTVGLWILLRLDKLKLRRRRKSFFDALKQFNYWRGVASAVGSADRYLQWRREAPDSWDLKMDAPVLEWTRLPEGSDLDRLLAAATLKGLRLKIGGQLVLWLPPEPGAEPLRLEHVDLTLRRLAAERFIEPLARHIILSAGGHFCLPQ